MIFAAVGDVHGSMYKMCDLLDSWEQYHSKKIDFVLQVGDFEAHTDESDLDSMACPSKYKKLGDFPAFKQRKSKFKHPIYFIGGNHESWSSLDQHSGEELAPNCTFLGRTGSINIEGLNISFLSGIYSYTNYADDKRGRLRGKFYETANKKLFTYYYKSEVDSLINNAARPVDVLMLHEWPKGAVNQQDFVSGKLKGNRRMGATDPGSEPAGLLVQRLNPKLILAGHMHWKYRSKINNSQFAAMAIIDAGIDALGVFEFKDGCITEIEGV